MTANEREGRRGEVIYRGEKVAREVGRDADARSRPRGEAGASADRACSRSTVSASRSATG